MPTYEYQDTRTGETVELVRTVAERDNVPNHLKRLTVPRRVAVKFGLLAEIDADNSVPKAFRDLEQTMPAREIARQAGFSIDHIKRVWAMSIALLAVSLNTWAADLSAGYTFADGEKNITAAKLNAVVGGAVINPAFVTGKSSASSVSGSDLVPIYSQSAVGLRRATIGQMVLNNTNLITGQSDVVTLGTNDVFLLYSVAGGGFRQIQAQNLFGNLVPNEQVSGSNTLWFAVYQPASNAWHAVSLTNLPAMLTPTNLASVGTPTNGELIQVYDQSNNVAKKIPLASIRPTFRGGPYAVGQGVGGVLVSNLHGLPGTPQRVRWTLICTNATIGYKPGDEIELSDPFWDNAKGRLWVGGANTNYVFLSAANVGGQGGTNTTQYLINPGTGAYDRFTNIFWNARVTAEYLP